MGLFPSRPVLKLSATGPFRLRLSADGKATLGVDGAPPITLTWLRKVIGLFVLLTVTPPLKCQRLGLSFFLNQSPPEGVGGSRVCPPPARRPWGS